jgi:type II secretory pathway pseudopilin PulG
MISQRGFTYIYVLLLIALIGAGLAMAGMVWRTEVKRAKEVELLFIGHEFRQALASFHSQTPGGEKRYPQSLEDLLLDPRFAQSVRHLRRIYRDPMTGQTEWGLARNANGDIVGIHSLSTEKPMKVGGFTAEDEALKGMDRYNQWVFAPAGALAGAGQEGETNLVSSQLKKRN